MPSNNSMEDKYLGYDSKSYADAEKGTEADISSTQIGSDDLLTIENESDHEIKFRSMSWQRAAALLFTEYICLAILAMPYSYQVLGYVGGTLVIFFIGLMTLYTSLILWKYCLANPGVKDITTIGYLLFGRSRIAMELTTAAFVLNNLFVMGFHVVTGAKAFNTITDHGTCTVVFAIATMVACILFTLPRTLKGLHFQALVSVAVMASIVLLNMIFAGVESHPGGWAGDPIKTSVATPKGTTFVAAFNAVLNITYTFVGQICIPSYIAEMERPEEFGKALWACTLLEIVLFAVAGAVCYHYFGIKYTQSPALASLQPVFKKIGFGLVLVPTIIIGAIYASVIVRLVFFRILKHSHHRHSNTVAGWSIWTGLVVLAWGIAFVIAEVIPFFGDLLSLISALFDGWFGFIFWAIAYWQLNRGKLFTTPFKTVESLFNVLLLAIGFMIFGVGTWTSIEAIITDYASVGKSHPFSCASNGV